MDQADVDRFRSKVAAEPEEDGCVMYLGGWNCDGYGIFWLDGKQVQAHRVAWTLQHGPIPDGLHVLHKCDNRYCVNIDHLFLGTAQDNVNDMIAKGRDTYGQNRGERNGWALLTEGETNLQIASC
jgi:hypothetical protein